MGKQKTWAKKTVGVGLAVSLAFSVGAYALLTSASVPSGAKANDIEQKVILKEVDPGYGKDAPDVVENAQTAPVLAPGRYGTELVSETETEKIFKSPMFDKFGDKDLYKITVYPGVLFRFKVTPHNVQDIRIELFNQDGRSVEGPERSWKYINYSYEWNKGAKGFAEELVYLHGLNLSHEEDGLTTFYIKVSDGRPSWEVEKDYKPGRYTIDYGEQNMADGNWTVDASDHLLRAPKLEWNKTYEGYLGYHDVKDCYQVDPTSAIGSKVTVTANPIDPSLDINIDPGESYYDANAQQISVSMSEEASIGSRKYTETDYIKTYNNGAKGFPNNFTIYPYYATGKYGSKSTFAYFCVRLDNDGQGKYQFSIKDEAGVGAAPAVADIAKVALPPEALPAPEPPEIRVKLPTIKPLFGDDLSKALVIEKTISDFKLGQKIPETLRNSTAEASAKAAFVEIYGRQPNLKKSQDRTAVETIAYDLLPKKRSESKETPFITKFKLIYGRDPVGPHDWSVVYAMTYSKVKLPK